MPIMVAVALDTDTRCLFKRILFSLKLIEIAIRMIGRMQADLAAFFGKAIKQATEGWGPDVIKYIGRAKGVLQRRALASHEVKGGAGSELLLKIYPIRELPE